jgi:hypothetical protein
MFFGRCSFHATRIQKLKSFACFYMLLSVVDMRWAKCFLSACCQVNLSLIVIVNSITVGVPQEKKDHNVVRMQGGKIVED